MRPDDIIQRSYLVVVDFTPVTGHSINHGLSRPPTGLDYYEGVAKYTSEARSRVGRPIEKICIGDRHWIGGKEFLKQLEADGRYGWPCKEDYPLGTVFATHGITIKNIPLISYSLRSGRADEFGRRGVSVTYTVLPSEADYNGLMKIISSSPAELHRMFRDIAQEHYDANKLPDEPKITVLFPLVTESPV